MSDDGLRYLEHLRATSTNPVLLHAVDEVLLERWLSGPGARPTEADRDRWAQAAREGRVPRTKRAP